ncbi:uncharacterized protein zgc:194621 isoform X2 [Oreochromis aureus]|uniref:uncharacterized protein zgc:194621 isoform X2 n=1 Tax=Oreochromis aureus TaxID=47969 RepID=UPI0019541262|nr:uncharacterized protein zgc:194621 isoform X2 [Oreochromis aureus]XP_039473141.1 uncharacterized protein zgc:194621 isoform X2 [Oreochromis aureus]
MTLQWPADEIGWTLFSLGAAMRRWYTVVINRWTQSAATLSNKAFTVIPPNPKKRREIQKKAEAELAALEELRLSRAMAYVSINPSSVGGCMSLEEVRSKQQQEMMLAKKKQKPMKKPVLEEASVLTS